MSPEVTTLLAAVVAAWPPSRGASLPGVMSRRPWWVLRRSTPLSSFRV